MIHLVVFLVLHEGSAPNTLMWVKLQVSNSDMVLIADAPELALSVDGFVDLKGAVDKAMDLVYDIDELGN